MSHTRYECVITPEASAHRDRRATPVISHEPLKKGMVVKISRTRWIVHVALPADSNRPELGDLIAQPITRTRKK